MRVTVPDWRSAGVALLAAFAFSAPAAAQDAGEQLYARLCAGCHGADGTQTARLAGSEAAQGPANTLAAYLFGGHINAAGGLAGETDEDIARVLSYVRRSFGNSAPPVSPGTIKRVRSR